ncbi:MAG: glycosyltransferase family 4 protein [Bacteroidota bacterium]
MDESTVNKETKKLKIVHLSSAHNDRDVRIFLKECRSLARNFPSAEVHLILAGVEERTEDGVHIHSVPKRAGNILTRMWRTVNFVRKKALEIQGDIYHLHDPELLRIAFRLKRGGKKVIYDAHEDLPRQISGKSYLPVKGLIAFMIEVIEDFVSARLSGVLAATPFIAERFKKTNVNTIDINNFPLETEIEFLSDTFWEKENTVCFIGGISVIRGTKELVDAMEFVDCQLILAGEIPEYFQVTLEESSGWKNVQALGFITRNKALEIKQKSIAGIVTFLPYPNHVNAQPNKIFEYMAAGLPVIGSDFPMWRDLLEKNYCGICVDPTNPKAIAEAINYLQNHPIEAKEMGQNGRRLVLETYNWKAEERKLFEFYQALISSYEI